MKKIIEVEDTAEEVNIKDYLGNTCSYSSRKIKSLLKNKSILINNKTAYWDNTVKKGDVLVIDLTEAGRDSTLPEEMDIAVVYEDEYFLAVNKPAGIIVHPTPNHPTGTLANGIKNYLIRKNLDIPIRFANRIDMDTSGLVVVAKSGEAHAALSARLDESDSRKYYLAVAEGEVSPFSGTIDKPIGIDKENPIRRAVSEDGQRSITEYEVMEQYKEAALLRLKLITGRTHQIRVHLSSIGHPLLGDRLYEGSTELIERQALHAYELIFTHPFTQRVIELQAPLPEDISALIDRLKGSTK
ncbi:MAG: pseudouridylate synthase [Clostridia bacterium]|jgi:23S rRNA pseudouridine1911/1915/1917 synthase|nr:pseudouridylate synthase [Clostridia bacterium]